MAVTHCRERYDISLSGACSQRTVMSSPLAATSLATSTAFSVGLEAVQRLQPRSLLHPCEHPELLKTLQEPFGNIHAVMPPEGWRTTGKSG